MGELSPSFGDVVENGWASEDNPTRRGFFVRAFKVAGRMDPGLTWEITDGKGKFWTFKPRDIGERLTVVPAARSEAQPSGYDGGKSLGERPIRPDLAIGAITVAMKTTTDGEVGPWLQTALDFLTGEYESLDDAALTFTASLSDASPKPSSDEQET